jgi:hypothetical protein
MLTGLFMLVTAATGEVARTGYEDTEARPNGIRGELGIASPIGIIGGTFWHEIVPPVRFEGGIGLGVSGVQLSALSRFVLGNEHHRVVPGIGLSIETCVSCSRDCGACAGDCCSVHATPGCDDMAVQACVCATMFNCCSFGWRQECAECASRADCCGANAACARDR